MAGLGSLRCGPGDFNLKKVENHCATLYTSLVGWVQDWPAESPDMNTIEHVWGSMKEEAMQFQMIAQVFAET